MTSQAFFSQYSAAIIMGACIVAALTLSAVAIYDTYQANAYRRRSDKFRHQRALRHIARRNVDRF